jgi:glutathione peroxidase
MTTFARNTRSVACRWTRLRHATLLATATALAVAALAIAPAPRAADAATCPPLLRHTFSNLQTGKPESLCTHAGKVVLVVNTASQCGYTPQYEGLERLYGRYRERGLVVVGFPANDFGGQEPGDNAQIARFCRTEFGIDFPMYEKSAVTGPRANPLFTELARRTGKAPGWNFHKYLIDREGAKVTSFDSAVAPEGARLTGAIEKLLAERARS